MRTDQCVMINGAVLNNSKNDGLVLLPSGEGGPKGRMRVTRPTIPRFLQNRGAGYPHPALRATLSHRERARAKNSFRFSRLEINHYSPIHSHFSIGVAINH